MTPLMTRLSFSVATPLKQSRIAKNPPVYAGRCSTCCLQLQPPNNSRIASTGQDKVVSRRLMLSVALASTISMISLPALSMDAPVSALQKTSKYVDIPARFSAPFPPRPRNDALSLREDIFYPKYFLGRWKVTSTLKSVSAPAGYKLFGRDGALEAVQQQVDQSPLVYDSRFIRAPGGKVISDRAYNTARIAAAAMGTDAVLDCVPSGINQIGLSLRPNSAEGAIFAVVLSVLARDCVKSDGKFLYVSELVRQSVRHGGETDLKTHSQVREIETSCLYSLNEGADFIAAKQRTVSYLPRSDLHYADAKGRPVDIRNYDLVYNRN